MPGRVTRSVLPWFGLRLDAGLSVPLIQTAFVVDGLGPVHSASAVTFRLGIGAEVYFR